MKSKLLVVFLGLTVMILGACGAGHSKEEAVKQTRNFIAERVESDTVKIKDYEVKEIGESSYNVSGVFTMQPHGVVITAVFSMDAIYNDSTKEWYFDNIQVVDMADINR